MAFELDHLFICTTIDAPEAEQLVSFGLTEGTPSVHPGQGTANRRFFFRNFMLELLWIHNPEEARSEPIQPVHLWERWADRNRGACPFGFCLRSTAHPVGILPFSTWEYRPPYLPASLNIPVATNAAVLTEPMLFYLAFGQRPDTYPAEKYQPLEHAAGLREVTRAELVTPYADSLSPELKAIVNVHLIRLRLGAEYLVELGFDGELQGQQIDCRPLLPFIWRW
jgi:hypothetical protein